VDDICGVTNDDALRDELIAGLRRKFKLKHDPKAPVKQFIGVKIDMGLDLRRQV